MILRLILNNQFDAAKKIKTLFSPTWHPDKVPKKWPNQALQEKVKEYVQKKFQQVTTDLDSIIKQHDDVVKVIQSMFSETNKRMASILASSPAYNTAVREVVRKLKLWAAKVYDAVIDARFALYTSMLTSDDPQAIERGLGAFVSYRKQQPPTEHFWIDASINQSVNKLKKFILDDIEYLKTIPGDEQKDKAPKILARVQAYEQAQKMYPDVLKADNEHKEILLGKQWIETTISGGTAVSLQNLAANIIKITDDLITSFKPLTELLYGGFIVGTGTPDNVKTVNEQVKKITALLKSAQEIVVKQVVIDALTPEEKQGITLLVSRLYRVVYNLRAKLELGYYIYDREQMRADPYGVFTEYEMLLPGQPLFQALKLKYLNPTKLPQLPLDKASTDKLQNMRDYLTIDPLSQYHILNETFIKTLLANIQDSALVTKIVNEAASTHNRINDTLKQLNQARAEIDQEHEKAQQRAQKLFADRADIAKSILAFQKNRDVTRSLVEQVIAQLTS